MKICLSHNIIESSNSLVEAVEHDSIGMLILSTIIKEAGHEVVFFDINNRINNIALALHEPELMDELANELLLLNVDVYGFSTIADGFPYQLLVAKKLKEKDESKLILLGGPQATVYDSEIMAEFNFVDYILRGESEDSIHLFLKEITEKNNNFESVKGLTYRLDDKVVRNEDVIPIKKLDTLPDIDYSMVDFSNKSSFQIEVGRGCPFSCSFCSSSTFFKRKYRMKSLDRIIKEVDFLQHNYHIDFLGFIHDLFTYNRDFILEFCNTLISSNRKLKWSCSARADSLDEEIINLMHEAGCIGIFIGIESGSETIQKNINKKLDLEYAKKIITYAIGLGINVSSSFILGFPTETYEDVITSFQYRSELYKRGIQEAHMLILRPMQGSRLHETSKLMEFDINLHLARVNRLNYNNEALDLIRSYPNVFSYYSYYETKHLTKNSIIALSCIVSTGNFEISEKLVWNLNFDHKMFLKSFDIIPSNSCIFDYEKHFINFLKEISTQIEGAWVVYQVAMYEYDILNFGRYVDENVNNDQIKICIKKYNMKVHNITYSNDVNEFQDNDVVKYVFYYSPKTLKTYIYQTSDEICEIISQFMIGKTYKEIKELLLVSGDKANDISLFKRIIEDCTDMTN